MKYNPQKQYVNGGWFLKFNLPREPFVGFTTLIWFKWINFTGYTSSVVSKTRANFPHELSTRGIELHVEINSICSILSLKTYYFHRYLANLGWNLVQIMSDLFAHLSHVDEDYIVFLKWPRVHIKPWICRRSVSHHHFSWTIKWTRFFSSHTF